MTPTCQACPFWNTHRPPGRRLEQEYQAFRPCRQFPRPGFTGRSTQVGHTTYTAPDAHCRAFLSRTVPPAHEAS
ncbi:hypothetical protein [Deinococcus cavernae]|uniref:hypothetical protein n=1 Tax=Deinococcus cavernae TaxID=2320857 RepID=UPI0011C20F10|nr:hypothetical protein [Deinococcus cavernae]